MSVTFNPSDPVCEEAAKVCESLLELSNPSRIQGPSSPSQEVLSNGQGSFNTEEKKPSPVKVSVSETLRDQVYHGLAGAILQQEEDKLTKPRLDSPLNLTNVSQATIRGQQIIDNVIENILDQPIDDANPPNNPVAIDTAEPATSVTIKASVYQSLKYDTNHMAIATSATTEENIKASIFQSLKNDRRGPRCLVPEAFGHQVPCLKADLRRAFGDEGPKQKVMKP